MNVKKKMQDQHILCKNEEPKYCFIVYEVLQTPCLRACKEVSMNSVNLKILFVAACFLALSSCATRKIVPPKTASTPKPARIGMKQVGIASWYGDPYHGRKAANGEIYDMNTFTAAHKSLPFETWVRVKNLSNNKTTEVRITDRGPFVAGRIIDLSRASATQIELIRPGTAKVRIQVIRAPRQSRKLRVTSNTL